MASIRAAVGLRNGLTPVANNEADILVVIGLLDRIPGGGGGTADIPEPWPTTRAERIAAVYAAILAFQVANSLPSQDGVVDPGGGTLRELNRAAQGQAGGITVAESPSQAGTWTALAVNTVDPNSVEGRGAIRYTPTSVSYTRRLYRVEGSSINWYGVVTPSYLVNVAPPLLYFTPTPYQGGCQDPDYDAFGGAWPNLYSAYTFWMGQQLAASGADLVLVIPFYRNAQTSDLGDFRTTWREAVAGVVGAALTAQDPLMVRDVYSFDSIYSASFSNGWIAHRAFHSTAQGAMGMTQYLFDLDGFQATPPSTHWRPQNSIAFCNHGATDPNPSASVYGLGGRWGAAPSLQGRGAVFSSHWAVTQYMLYYGLWRYAT